MFNNSIASLNYGINMELRAGASPGEKNVGWTRLRARGARVYNGAWGASPQRGPGQSPWSGSPGAKPPTPWSWKPFSFAAQRKQQIFFILQAPNHDRPNPLLPSKNSPDLHQSQERPLAKVGWTCPPQSTPVHPVATPLVAWSRETRHSETTLWPPATRSDTLQHNVHQYTLPSAVMPIPCKRLLPTRHRHTTHARQKFCTFCQQISSLVFTTLLLLDSVRLLYTGIVFGQHHSWATFWGSEEPGVPWNSNSA